MSSHRSQSVTTSGASGANKPRSRSEQVAIYNSTFRASRGGQTLIEAMVAIAIAMLVVTALIGLGVRTIRAATISRNISVAASYAQQGIEAIRSIRDRGYDHLASCTANPSRIYWHPTESHWACQAGEEVVDSIFTRSFTVTESPVGKLQVRVTVAWSDVSGSHTIPVDTYFTDWR